MAGASPPPFQIDPRRLYEVQENGQAWTDESPPVLWLGQRHLSVLAWGLGGGALLALVGGIALAALAAGAQRLAALAGLVALPCMMLPATGLLLDWWRHRRGMRKQHAERPPHFPH